MLQSPYEKDSHLTELESFSVPFFIETLTDSVFVWIYFHFRTFSDLLEVSSLVSRETVLIKQSLEEEEIGPSTAQTLFCPSTL